MLAASFLHSSFLRTISAVMLWPIHVQKAPQALKHLCRAKLQTRCDVCCACQYYYVCKHGINRGTWNTVFGSCHCCSDSFLFPYLFLPCPDHSTNEIENLFTVSVCRCVVCLFVFFKNKVNVRRTFILFLY